MPSKTTITLQNTINWLTAFVLQRPVTGVGGNTNEPFLTTANKVMATIMAQPFIWEWNRTSLAAAITTVAGTSDYSVALSNFGFLEKATINYVASPPTGQNN